MMAGNRGSVRSSVQGPEGASRSEVPWTERRALPPWLIINWRCSLRRAVKSRGRNRAAKIFGEVLRTVVWFWLRSRGFVGIFLRASTCLRFKLGSGAGVGPGFSELDARGTAGLYHRFPTVIKRLTGRESEAQPPSLAESRCIELLLVWV